MRRALLLAVSASALLAPRPRRTYGAALRAKAKKAPQEFDLVILGGGPVGVSAALRAASLGRSAVVVDATPANAVQFAGPTGLFSKALRDCARRLDVSTLRAMGLGDAAVWAQVRESTQRITKKCGADNAARLFAERVPCFRGQGTVVRADSKGVAVDVAFRRTTRSGSAGTTVLAKHALVATGSRAVRFDGVAYDDRVFDSDSIKGLDFLPRSVIVVGGGIIAVEYARIFAALDADVTMVVRSTNLPTSLERVGIDKGLAGALSEDLKNAGIKLLFRTEVRAVDRGKDGVTVALSEAGGGAGAGSRTADILLTATGRSAVTEGVFGGDLLNVLAPNGDVAVNARLASPAYARISAAGDCVGAPQLASTGVAQAEAAVDAMFAPDFDDSLSPEALLASAGKYPVAIWTVPELAFCGVTSAAAKRANLDVVTGLARYADTVRGEIAASPKAYVGPCLKVVVDRAPPHVIRGVHIFGEDAAELVHFGTGLVRDSKTCGDAVDLCYAAVTYHELYKLAARDALSRVRNDALRNAFGAMRGDGKVLERAAFDAKVGAARASRAIFAGAPTVKGDAFVKRAARLPAREIDEILAGAGVKAAAKPAGARLRGMLPGWLSRG